MDEPRPGPFTLNRSRIFLLAMGLLVLLISLSTALGGLSGYQQLKNANAAARDAALAAPATGS